jgi:CRISPR-associated endonuclease Csn1
MTKILGLDLGTNSIGWAIRITDEAERKEFLEQFKKDNGHFGIENQIVDYNVVVFKKGVGDGKSGEFSLAAERRANRSKRRLYNAKRYRKWELLKVLVGNNMCPLSMEKLRLWSIGDWKNENGEWKNKGRKYPMGDEWLKWLAMDKEYFGHNGIIESNHDGKPSYKRKSPYNIRCELLTGFESDETKRKNKIGRALYHLVQRRGFKTSRKSGKSSYGESELLKKFYEKYPEKQHWKTSQVFTWLQAEDCPDTELRLTRIRKDTGVLQRSYYEEELFSICKMQKLPDELTEKLHKAIYHVRPLRSQKGLVGKCTLEKGKPRIPVSHPAYEEFRALSFINNIQWKESGSRKPFEPIPMALKKKIFAEMFFKRSLPYFPFKDDKKNSKNDISNRFSEGGRYEFNFDKHNPTVSGCPVIAGIMSVFDEEWKEKLITNENKIGVNWGGLTLTYQVKYGTRKKKGKTFVAKQVGEERKLTYEGIWHLLFDYIQTWDDEEGLRTFCKEVLSWDDDKTDAFIDIDVRQGYGSLSKSAITRILPFLQQGKIYSEAVSFANLSKVLGKDEFARQESEIVKAISNAIKEVDETKDKLNIVNGLIQQFFGETYSNRAKGIDEQLKIQAEADVYQKLKGFFGEENWNNKPKEEQQRYFDFVLEKYLTFLDGKQTDEEKASSAQQKKATIDYYKLPRLDEAIKKILKKEFNATDGGLKHLYHPSDIDIYPKANGNKLVDPQPPSRGWKNPMAMRTMHELRKLLQYLIDIGKIDRETKIVVEMARELNDANKRWAIQYYQRKREEENIEFAKAIIGVAREKYPALSETDVNNIEKIRLWWEQLENGDDFFKQIKALKEDVQKYRLWKEQQCQCMYTGKLFGISDLFDGTKTQFEHTFPVSDSFDNSLANLTVCDANYNMNIKKDQIPTELPNYHEDWNGYSPIEKRVERWIQKRDSLIERIKGNVIETKKAIRRGDIDWKNKLIRDRHLLRFDLDYWDKKVKTFTFKEIPNWWKNSQLVDTQIITKFSRAYLKSFFNRVDVQKGTVTAEFRKVYGIMGDERKDRGKHSHHAVDAAVLTLIPGSAKREDILKQYYKSIESRNEKSFIETPYPKFSISHILEIEKNAFINHTGNDRTLTKAKKKVRVRGRIKKGKNGKVSWKQGDSIRGQLHKETFFGAIKPPVYENGYAKKENGKYMVRRKNDIEEIWIVARKPIESVDIAKDKIIDEVLKEYIEKQLVSGSIKSISEARDFSGNKIRHLRCAFKAGRGYLTKEKAIELRRHSHPPKKEHRQYVLVQNSQDGNYLYLVYEKWEEATLIRKARIVTLLERQGKDFPGIKGLWNDKGYNQLDGVLLKYIVKVGQTTIFYSETKDELKELDDAELKKRVFVVYKFNESGTPDIYLKNMIEARPTPEIDKLCENSFDPKKYQVGLSLKVAKLNCVFEGKDFEIKPDGEIKWL